MKKLLSVGFMLSFVVMLLWSCKKTYDTTVYKGYADYTNINVGKVIIYKLDSTITRSFGSSFIVSSYTVKDSIIEELVDNSNRKSFKVFRYHLNGQNQWNPVNTFYYTPLDNSLEYVENNQRYIKLVNPINADKTWLGNNYLSQPIFHQNSFYQSWNFHYEDIGQPKTIGNLSFNNTVTVVMYDSSDNRPFMKYAFNTYDKGYEIYAENIGLVYRDVMSWEYQPTTKFTNCNLTYPNPVGTGTVTIPIDCDLPDSKCDSLRSLANHKIVCDTVLSSYYYNGYGVKQQIISHN